MQDEAAPIAIGVALGLIGWWFLWSVKDSSSYGDSSDGCLGLSLFYLAVFGACVLGRENQMIADGALAFVITWGIGFAVCGSWLTIADGGWKAFFGYLGLVLAFVAAMGIMVVWNKEVIAMASGVLAFLFVLVSIKAIRGRNWLGLIANFLGIGLVTLFLSFADPSESRPLMAIAFCLTYYLATKKIPGVWKRRRCEDDLIDSDST